MTARTCDNAYCSNGYAPRGSYERAMGIACDACEDAAAEAERINPECPECSVRKDEHDDPFPCPEEELGNDGEPIPAEINEDTEVVFA